MVQSTKKVSLFVQLTAAILKRVAHPQKAFSNILTVRELPITIGEAELAPLFPDAMEIVVNNGKTDANQGRTAYVMLPSHEDAKIAATKQLSVGNHKLEMSHRATQTFNSDQNKLRRLGRSHSKGRKQQGGPKVKGNKRLTNGKNRNSRFDKTKGGKRFGKATGDGQRYSEKQPRATAKSSGTQQNGVKLFN